MADSVPLVLAVDAHGGDHGPGVTVPASVAVLSRNPQFEISLCGLPADLEPRLRDVPTDIAARIRLIEAHSVIAPDARALHILRKGQGSSLWTALQEVAEGRAQACISAGNTAALVTLGIKLLGLLQGIRRPALMSHIPSERGVTSMLDLGANVNVEAGQLVQFAIMGSVVRSQLDGQPASIGLLNVGHEDSKGHEVVREAHQRLRSMDINYQGFIEGHDIFAGKVDVAVCDGFAGNLILKASEGLTGMLFAELNRTLQSDLRSKAGAALARPALHDMLARLDPAKHNGAPLLGLNNVLVKSHGNASQLAMQQAILEAGREAARLIPEHIGRLLNQNRKQTES